MPASLDDVVTLRHPQGDIACGAAVLAVVSPVFAGWLRDSEAPYAITVDSVPHKGLKAFVSLARSVAWDGDGAVTADDAGMGAAELSRYAHLIIPLCHKYDAAGLLRAIKGALNECPLVLGVLTMVKYDADAAGTWMGPRVLDRLVDTLLPGLAQGDDHMALQAAAGALPYGWTVEHVRAHVMAGATQRLEALPPALLARLLVYTFYEKRFYSISLTAGSASQSLCYLRGGYAAAMKALSWWNVYEDIETKSQADQEASANAAAVMADGVGAELVAQHAVSPRSP